MRKAGFVIVTVGINRITGDAISKSIPVYNHDNEWYVKKEDLNLLINLTSDLCNTTEKFKCWWKEAIKELRTAEANEKKWSKKAHRRGRLIARLQRKLHDCYKTIDQFEYVRKEKENA